MQEFLMPFEVLMVMIFYISSFFDDKTTRHQGVQLGKLAPFKKIHDCIQTL